MEEHNHILFAYVFDGLGGAKPIKDLAEVASYIKAKKLSWAHINANDPGAKEWLDREISYLDPYVVQALTEDETRPRALQIDDGALVILRGVNLHQNASPEDMISIRMWIDKSRIITVQKRQLKALLDIEDKIISGKGPKNSGDFLSTIVARLFERMEPALAKLDEHTDNIEENVVENADISMREEIISIRKKAIIFKRYMSPQKDAVLHLRSTDISWLSSDNKRHLQESFDRISRYVENLDAVRERAQIVKDELSNALSEKLNKNMYILSVIAAIFLPLGFLTGLLGINVGGIPGAEQPDAFFIFSGLLVVVVLLQVLIFKKLKWF